MKLPKLKTVLREDKLLSNGTFPLFIRITYNRKSIYVSVGHGCLICEWNGGGEHLWEVKPKITTKQKGELSKEQLEKLKKQYQDATVNPQAKTINRAIENLLTKIDKIIKRLDANGESLDVQNIKKAMKPVIEEKPKQVSFISFFKEELKLIEAGNKYNTYRNYNGTLNLINEQYLKGKDLAFSDFNLDFLQKFEIYLKNRTIKTDRSYKTDSIHKHLKNLRAIYNKGVKKGFVDYSKNPFLLHRLKLDKHKRKERLTENEINLLQNVELRKGTRLNDARNIFLFAFYHAGIRIGDLLQLKWDYIVDGRLEYEMDKTGKPVSMKILPPAMKIIDEYRESNHGGAYIFPFFTHELNPNNEQFVSKQVQAKTSLINKCLKQIAATAGIAKNLSTHIARHTFADLARKKGTGMHDIKNLLRHSRLNTTEGYMAGFDYDSQDTAHENIIGSL
ncbi:site-specific integrase [Pseudocnuella soli]|uniref:site-specific integrase n=1 Tax=Pseudocnuella soli TaxID=2502779 RepID=UPI0014053EBC|nr:site-specific integrase [Pseudocnuella soli]